MQSSCTWWQSNGGLYIKVCFEKLLLKKGKNKGADQVMVEKKISTELSSLKSYPSLDEVNKLFQDLNEIFY